jgi:preprotein translocase subunit YajC
MLTHFLSCFGNIFDMLIKQQQKKNKKTKQLLLFEDLLGHIQIFI